MFLYEKRMLIKEYNNWLIHYEKELKEIYYFVIQEIKQLEEILDEEITYDTFTSFLFLTTESSWDSKRLKVQRQFI